MKNLISVTKRKFNQFLGLFPTKLPVGIAEFNVWAQKFNDTYTLPTQDMMSIKFVLASSLLNFNQTTSHKSLFFFYRLFNAAAAKQVASSVFREIKQQQQDIALASQNETK